MSGGSVRMNDVHRADETRDGTLDDEHMPPISTLFAGWKFWWTFAVWPVIFCIVNGVVFGTLVVFDEFEYNSRRDGRYNKDPSGFGYSYPGTSENTYLSMLRFNATVFTIVLFIDAALLYVAARVVEKEVTALDELDEDVENNGTRTAQDSHHVHGQVSRKLDVILGRGPRPRGSILVSLLFLACAMSAAFGVSSVAEWCFTWTATARKVCKSRFQTSRGSYDSGSKEKDKRIEGIPDELQKWAKQRDFYRTTPTGNSFLQLKDRTTFLTTKDPRPSGRNESNDDDMYMGWNSGSSQVLAAVYADGTAKFFHNVVSPRLTVRLTDNGVDDPLNTSGFCSVYNTIDTANQLGRGSRDAVSSVSMLCVDSSDFATVQSMGEFRNVTLVQFSKSDRAARRRGATTRQLIRTSLNWHANAVWVMIVFERATAYDIVYYNATVAEGLPLSLTSVGNVTEKIDRDEDEWYGMMRGAESGCSKRREYMQALTLGVSFLVAYAWLKRVRNMIVGIVPLQVAAVVLFGSTSHQLAAVLSILFSLAAFCTLQGCGMPKMSALGTEELVWMLYTGLVAAANVGSTNLEEFWLFAFLGCCVAGTMLGHPALYLAGWAGGIGAVLAGIFLLFIKERVWGIKSICLGVIGGPGCVTVGLFLIKYRSYFSYYAKRAWQSVTIGMRTAGSSGHQQSDEATLTDNLLHRDS